jgi:hypothetical protein
VAGREVEEIEMRFWISGPRILGLRPGVSLDDQDDLDAMVNGKIPLIFRVIGVLMFLAALPVLAVALWVLWLIVSNWR